MLLLLKSKTTTRGAIFFFRIRWRKEIRDDPSPSNDEDSVRCDPTNQEWPFLLQSVHKNRRQSSREFLTWLPISV